MPGTYKEYHIKTCIGTVTTAGTSVRFLNVGGPPDYYKVKAISIRANADNTGNLYFGGDNRVVTTDFHRILAPGEVLDISVLEADKFGDLYLDMTEWWMDADTDGNGWTFAAIIDKVAY